MRVLRIMTAVVVAMAGTLALQSPASALTNYVLTHPDGDKAYWHSGTNMLTVCDNSPNNGTALAHLAGNGGGLWRLYDSNGAQPGCTTAGPLNVSDGNFGTLYLLPATVCQCEFVSVPVKL